MGVSVRSVSASVSVSTSRFVKRRACHEICTSSFTMRCACHEICTSRFTMRCACHEICTSRFTKCCACHEICTSRFTKCFTKCCTCHEICTSRSTKCCACHEVCTSRFTKCCACHEICTSRFTKRYTCHEICTSRPATKSANEPHVQKSRLTTPVTKSDLLDDHHHVQSAAPATKTAFRSETAPIPCTCHEKSTLEHQNTRFPLHLPRRLTTIRQKHPPPAGRFCEPAQSKCTWTMSRGMNAL